MSDTKSAPAQLIGKKPNAHSAKLKDLTIAVKTGEKKRKVGEAVEEAFKEAEKFKESAGGKKKKQKSSKR
jgi:N-acetyltransferase 10